MQLDGVQINPVEWWDPHWVHDRILSKMGAQFESAEGGTSDVATPSPAPAKRRVARARKKKR